MSKANATKNRILDEAVRVISADGLESLTIGRLADRLDMSKSGLFGHFKSKENLQLAAMARVDATFFDDVLNQTAGLNGEAWVRAFFAAWLDWASSDTLPGGCPYVVASVEFDDKKGQVRDTLRRTQAALIEAIEKQIGADAGNSFRPDIDAAQAAFEIYTLYLGHHYFKRALADKNARQKTENAFEDLMAKLKRQTV